MANIIIKAGIIISGFYRIDYQMVKEKSILLMVIFLKGNLLMEKLTDMEKVLMEMEAIIILDNGRMI